MTGWGIPQIVVDIPELLCHAYISKLAYILICIKLNAVGHVVQVLSTVDLYPLENYICQSLLF
jgi:hypothetical protein